jgi:two-component system chemotaxis sensor kinase CheA
VDPELLRQVWPIFSVEAREQLAVIGGGLLQLETSPERTGLLEPVRRTAHSLKGAAASLGLAGVEQLAHALEGALAGYDPGQGLGAEVVQASLDALEGIEEALVAGDAGRAPEVARLESLLASLAAASPGGPRAVTTLVAGAPAAPGPPVPPATFDEPLLRQLLERGEPAPNAGDRSVRVLASTLDRLAHRVEQLLIGEARQVRRAREAGALEESAREAMRRLDLTLHALPIAGVERAAIDVVLAELRLLAGGLRTMAREGHAETEQQRLTGALLRDDLRALRMVPAATVLEPLRVAVRELSGRLGRPVELALSGGQVRIDRRLADELRDPLLHLVRNAVGHGIEPGEARRAAGKPEVGRLSIRVEPRGSRVGVVVEDDGAGLDLAAIRARATEHGLLGDQPDGRTDAALARLIFTPGFSTAIQVTSISGRGVGLDVVLDAVTRLGGAVEVRSEPGRSTRFDLDLPQTLSATAAILVRIGDDLAALPADAVERVVLLSAGDIQVSAGGARARVGDQVLPHAALASLLGLQDRAPGEPLRPALVLAMGSRRAVVTPDEVLGQQELLVSSIAVVAAGLPHLIGAAVLDDGRIVGLLNPAELLRRMPAAGRAGGPRAARVLVADDAQTTRSAMKGLLEEAGFEVTVAEDGAQALRLAAEAPPALVVTDVEMRGVGGLELTRRLKADPRLRSVPVVMVTSLDTPEARAAGLDAGADAYLVKRDLARHELVELLRRLAGP